MAEKHTPNCASYLILENDDQILLMKRQNTGFRDGMYSLVAGHVDEGENFRKAMVRETEEEIGVEIDRNNLETVSVMHRKSDGEIYVDIFFRTDTWIGKPSNEEPEKCEELIWSETDNLPENTIKYVQKVIHEMDEGLEYQELGW